jgi:hypothetical protein
MLSLFKLPTLDPFNFSVASSNISVCVELVVGCAELRRTEWLYSKLQAYMKHNNFHLGSWMFLFLVLRPLIFPDSLFASSNVAVSTISGVEIAVGFLVGLVGGFGGYTQIGSDSRFNCCSQNVLILPKTFPTVSVPPVMHEASKMTTPLYLN